MACDGGGGPAGHPRIFINTDKPEIAVCNYCGLPFVRRVFTYNSTFQLPYPERGERRGLENLS